MKKHVQTITEGLLKNKNWQSNCGECSVSCQSACKTSCTVGNQKCLNYINKN